MKYILLLIMLLPTAAHSQIVEHMWSFYYDGFIKSAIGSFEGSYYRFPLNKKELRDYVQNSFLDEEVLAFYAKGEYHLQKDSIYYWIDNMMMKSVPGYCFYTFSDSTPTFYIERNRCEMRKDYRKVGLISAPTFLDQKNFPIREDDVYDDIREEFRSYFIRPLYKMINEKYAVSGYDRKNFILHYENDSIKPFCDDCICLIESDIRQKMHEGLIDFINACPKVRAINFLIKLPVKKCDE